MAEEIAGTDNLRALMNELGKKCEPFLFLIDYRMEKGVVLPLADMPGSGLSCCIGEKSYGPLPEYGATRTEINIEPVAMAEYAAAFGNVADKIRRGDSYLVNLTFRTPIGRHVDMAYVFRHASAPYRFLWPDRFVFFSPESFVRIDAGGTIRSYPMKGTADASHPDAENRLLSDYKERCEHNTIVDLIRNDLSAVADNVRVGRFRYIEKIRTHRGELLQSSSEVSGRLPHGWRNRLGDIIFALLPAGSISGAPKRRTVEIIEESETAPRGYYTGVMGVYENGGLESCVAIRFIEKDASGEYYYRSGGGITSCSIMENEYEEMLGKIYVPIV